MFKQQHHEMVLEKTHSSGAEEWVCPTCGRRLLFQSSQMVILQDGDQYAQHSGSTGGLHIGSLQVTQDDEAPLTDDSQLALWLAGLEEIDFDEL